MGTSPRDLSLPLVFGDEGRILGQIGAKISTPNDLYRRLRRLVAPDPTCDEHALGVAFDIQPIRDARIMVGENDPHAVVCVNMGINPDQARDPVGDIRVLVPGGCQPLNAG
jgi:hypothetical protein